ncbi:MAG: ketopantoate reductase family protein [Thermoanaerobaculia bacterium]
MESRSLRIAVLGAGGVGGYYGGVLARAGYPVALLARGAHLAAIRARGLEVRTPDETFTVKVEAADDAAALGAADLAIVAVKTYSLAEILPAARVLAGKGAIILPLLNGVEAADRLVAAGVPKANVLGGLTQVSVARVAPGVVERKSPFQNVALGEIGGGGSARAEKIAQAFRDAGAQARVSEDIVADLWRKFAFIAPMAAACGLARAPIGPVRDAPYGKLLLSRAVREVLAVARARGVKLADDDEAKILAFVDSLGPAMKPSFLLDLEAGGPTELDDLSGAVARLGRESGVETPVHDTATAALGAVRPRTQ